MDASLAERLAALAAAERALWLGELGPERAQRLLTDWRFWARSKQLPPAGDWHCWLVLAGRGFGKTRMGAEWVRSLVMGKSPLSAAADAPAHLALVADSHAEARDVMVEGGSGLLAISAKDQRPVFEISRRRLVWPNGAVASLYSAEDPDGLRGPQHHFAWADELAKWRHGGDVWSNLAFGLRLGARPRAMVTTTPRAVAHLRALLDDPKTVVTRGSTTENRAHLPPAFLAQIESRYAGTRLGRQEIDGELLAAVEGALWQPEWIDAARVREPPHLIRIVVAVDPPVSSGQGADACGIVAAGLGVDREYYILGDASLERASPDAWARRALALYHELGADRLVAEVNNGGDLVESLIRGLDPHVAYRAVRASRGKIARAEPVAALYERGLVHHVGALIELEDEMTFYVPGRPSPDRMDALVWALTELGAAPSAPRIRPFHL